MGNWGNTLSARIFLSIFYILYLYICMYICLWFYVCVRQARSMQSWHITATPLGVTNQITLKWFPLAWIFVPYKSRDGVCGMSGQKKHLPKNIFSSIYISSHTDSTDQTPPEEYHILLLRFGKKNMYNQLWRFQQISTQKQIEKATRMFN